MLSQNHGANQIWRGDNDTEGQRISCIVLTMNGGLSHVVHLLMSPMTKLLLQLSNKSHINRSNWWLVQISSRFSPSFTRKPEGGILMLSEYIYEWNSLGHWAVGTIFTSSICVALLDCQPQRSRFQDQKWCSTPGQGTRTVLYLLLLTVHLAPHYLNQPVELWNLILVFLQAFLELAPFGLEVLNLMPRGEREAYRGITWC